MNTDAGIVRVFYRTYQVVVMEEMWSFAADGQFEVIANARQILSRLNLTEMVVILEYRVSFSRMLLRRWADYGHKTHPAV